MASYEEPSSGIKISVSGAGEETNNTREVMSKEIQRNVERWSRFSSVNMININIERHTKGGKVKYSVEMEATGDGAHHADAFGWSPENAMHEALERMNEMLLKKKERTAPGSKTAEKASKKVNLKWL
jgi:ribosome-associated translation inhibitor RaiA